MKYCVNYNPIMSKNNNEIILNDEKIQIKLFKTQMTKYILTSRFNSDTYASNKTYREQNYLKIGCIYGCPNQIARHILPDAILFILEMNNSTNQIMGIGMIRNRPICGHKLYTNRNYNKYIYAGKYRIGREEMNEEEYNIIIRFFDIICFTGNRHMKRGQGLLSLSINILYKCRNVLDITEYISNMFKKRINH
jgi:hypothetical protein